MDLNQVQKAIRLLVLLKERWVIRTDKIFQDWKDLSNLKGLLGIFKQFFPNLRHSPEIPCLRNSKM